MFVKLAPVLTSTLINDGTHNVDNDFRNIFKGDIHLMKNHFISSSTWIRINLNNGLTWKVKAIMMVMVVVIMMMMVMTKVIVMTMLMMMWLQTHKRHHRKDNKLVTDLVRCMEGSVHRQPSGGLQGIRPNYTSLGLCRCPCDAMLSGRPWKMTQDHDRVENQQRALLLWCGMQSDPDRLGQYHSC